MNHRIRTLRKLPSLWALCLVLLCPPFALAESTSDHALQNPDHLFAMPRISEQLQTVIAALSMKQFKGAEQGLRRITTTYPWHMQSHYLLATLLSTQGRTDEAFASLENALAQGFSNQTLLYKDQNLKALRTDPRFNKLAEKLIQQNTQKRQSPPSAITSFPVRGKLATVSKDNTVWDGRIRLLKTYFKFNSRKATTAKVQNTKDAAAQTLNDLYRRGLAAGNIGDLYDNRDRKHSTLNSKSYPQLSFTKYSDAAQRLDIDYGLNTKIVFNANTIGNSSTAISSGPFWRSQARLAYTIPGGPKKLFLQYLNNQLYIFPAVRDYTSKGDHLPTNTPYLILSDGKSGSDQPFLRAVATILAAFKPAEKDQLAKTGKLMPAVQMLFRKGQKTVKTKADYLSAKAHPTVFQKENIDLLKMIRLANALKADEFPSIVQLNVLKETGARSGIDDFSRHLPELLFNTPASIARVIRNSAFEKRLTVQAAVTSQNPLEKMTYKWVILQGDARKISITPQNKSATIVEIKSSWHEKFPVPGKPDIKTNRVEIAVFADNGKQISAPSFVTLLYPPNEQRIYDDKGKILSIDHRALVNQYADPQVFARRNWRDTYTYTEQGKLVGWTRTRKSEKTEFTYHGAKIIKKDAMGRAIKAEQIGYQYKRNKSGHMIATENPLGTFLEYQYLSAQDRLGILVKQ